MNNDFFDPIVAEVRQNREELLQSFGGDIQKLDTHMKTQRAKWKAAGFDYESEADRQTRIARHREYQEAERKRIANI